MFKALDKDGNGELVIPEYLRVWGRWASSAFQAYLWESSEDARGGAAKMVASRGSLTVTRQC